MTLMDGVIIFDKPEGISSHQAVQRMRRLTGVKRIGHLGTLDPMGTGVLPMVIGRATRLAQFFHSHERTYETAFRFGFATDSYDRTGERVGEITEVALDREQLEAAMAPFRGKIEQMPPPISAKKISGVPAYKLARQNKPVPLEPSPIEIHAFELLGIEGDRARIRVRCSTGTYVRSLAHDIGKALGCGAHVDALRRTAAGDFTIERAYTQQCLEELRDAGRLAEALLSLVEVLPELPAERVDVVTASRIAHGRDFRVSTFSSSGGAKLVKAISPDGRLIAIGEARLQHLYHPIVVL